MEPDEVITAPLPPVAVKRPRRNRWRSVCLLFLLSVVIGSAIAFLVNVAVRERAQARQSFLRELADRSQSDSAASDAGESGAPPLLPIPHDAAATHYLPLRVDTFPNGMRVVILEDHRLPKVSFRLRIAAGTVYDSIDSHPAAADTAASLAIESGPRDNSHPASTEAPTIGEGDGARNSLAYEFEDQGGSVKPSVSRDDVIFYGSGFAERAIPMLQLLANRLQHLDQFSQPSLDRIHLQANNSANRSLYGSSLIDRVSNAVLLAGTPYADPPALASNIRAIRRADVARFYQTHYRPESTILGIEGDVNAETLLPILRAAFGGWQSSTKAPLETPDTNFTPLHERRVHLIDWPSEPSVALSVRALTADPRGTDMPALYVANQILGATGAGRFFQNLREDHQLVYDSYAYIDRQRTVAIWSTSATVTPHDTAEAVAGILAGIHDLQRRPVGANELERAKNAFIGRSMVQEQTPGMQMAEAVSAMAEGLAPDTFRTMIGQIEAVTPADVQAVTRRYLRDDGLQIIALGPARRLAEDMATFGPVNRYDTHGIQVFMPSDIETTTPSVQ